MGDNIYIERERERQKEKEIILKLFCLLGDRSDCVCVLKDINITWVVFWLLLL